MAVPTQPPLQAAASSFLTTTANAYKSWIDYMSGQGTAPARRDYCFAYLAGSSTLTAATNTTVALDTEVIDTNGMHTGSNGFFTIQTAGTYDIRAQVNFPSGGTSGRAGILVCHTATGGGSLTAVAMDDTTFSSAGALRVNVSAPHLPCAAGDVITLQGFFTPGGTVVPSSGSSPNIQYNTWMSALWLTV